MARNHHIRHRRHAKRHDSEMNGLAEREAAPEPQTTVLSVVYVTAAATFTGSVGGYTTLGVSDSGSSDSQTQVSEQESAPSSTDSSGQSPSTSPTSIANSGIFYTASMDGVATSSSAYGYAPLTTALAVTSLITSTSSTLPYASQDSNTAFAAASSAPSTQASTSAASSGMSTGTKIGLVVGIIIVLAAVAAGILLLYAKKKKKHDEHQRQDDEKASLAAGAAAESKKSQNTLPPRLSLRPMSRLMRLSSGNPLNMLNTPAGAGKGSGRNLTPSPNGLRSNSPWERRAEGGPESANNPFKDPQNPFSDPEKVVSSPSVAGTGSMDAGAASARAGALAARAANAQQPDGQAARQPSPEPETAATLAPNSEAPSNVHRVMLEFKPSMDDELELRAGQLVRMLHEYDDGWALCIRLDRSQQGVAPRTCLSARPCKPRPAGGPRGPMGPPNGRMSPAMGGPNGRMSPAMGVPNGRMSPAVGGPNGRMSPAMSGRMSPAIGGPNGRMSPAIGGPGGRMSPAMGGPNSRINPAMGSPNSRMNPAAFRNGPRNVPPQQEGPGGEFNQAPRPLSPPPRPSPKWAQANQRRRSNSAGQALTGAVNNGPPSAWPLPSRI